jgi:hypothetical protein
MDSPIYQTFAAPPAEPGRTGRAPNGLGGIIFWHRACAKTSHTSTTYPKIFEMSDKKIGR